ncbi:class I SAM-dependent methyltransferase [Mesorhizobium sp. NZP2234]|uniref:class I SAM-dependent methyltransferase n=1 Tax=Mesorhizobium sp. NZP2234 TaxID=2483402 RepID=UPI0015539F98|nr:class I SAM-dependent methyltransferase [Mesorhizobium sp. NZP2234]QKC91430.1 class I SAM-dependent methyltransferase [Mesorhizobium sp. NZP2234]
MKKYTPLPDYEEMVKRWLSNYDTSNYQGGLSAYVLRETHSLIEKPFNSDVHLSQILEVGAGTLAHLPFVRHSFDRYIASDFDDTVLKSVSGRKLPHGVELMKLDGAALPFESDSFDRLIATHVLEHVPFPHIAIEEWVRVLKPGGVLSVLLPCDPGWAWRIGRAFGPRKQAERAGLPYDYYMAREHINSIFNLSEILNFHFPERQITWWPSRIPVPDVNLIYAGNFYV